MRALIICFVFSYLLPVGAQPVTMERFIDDLMHRMSVDEKIGQLNLITPGGNIPTGSVVSTNVEDKIAGGQVGGLFGIWGPDKVRQAQELAMKSRLKIPMLFGLDVIHGFKTVFPIPLAMSCTWDMDLIRLSARTAAQEATADGVCWNFSPMVDIARDARWGRISEGSGEDVYLGARIARAMVEGYQDNDLSRNNTIMACVKHFALYGASEAGRDYNTVDMSRRVMFQDYLPPYKAALDAGAGSIMSSFNVVDGIPATGNKWLLTDVLRHQWGYEGMVVSDYTSVSEMINHGMGDLQHVSTLALTAGLDMDMVSEGFLTTLKKSLNEGGIKEVDINQACRRILEAKYRLGLFNDPFLYCDPARPAKDILTPENRKLARIAAASTFVLLKNKENILPLKKTAKIALVGPLADNQKEMFGPWTIVGDANQTISVRKSLENAVGSSKIFYAKGANINDDPAIVKKLNPWGNLVEIDPRPAVVLLKKAVDQAKKSDVVVAVMGESQNASGEASSVSDLNLPQSQRQLLEALIKTGKPVILVLFNGRPLTLPWEAEHMTAILNVWFGGIEGANAIVDVLFGDQFPGGKLTTTFPRRLGQIPLYYNHLNTGRPLEENNKFTTKYLDVSNDPLFPFGFGLSYTTFKYSPVEINKTTLSGEEILNARVTVTNTGARRGSEVVQMYIQDKVASISRPVKELKGFKKIVLEPGASTEVVFEITTNELKFFDNELNYFWEPGEFIIHIGTNSGETQHVQVTWMK